MNAFTLKSVFDVLEVIRGVLCLIFKAGIQL